MNEKRFIEFRADGEGRLSGTVVPYGSETTIGKFREQFAPGAFGLSARGDIIANLQHDRTKPVARTGAGLTLRDGDAALEADIELPDTVYGREARELVDAKILRGFSVEFRAVKETWKGNLRTIESAQLLGFGIVDKPAYTDAEISERFESPATDPRPGRVYY